MAKNIEININTGEDNYEVLYPKINLSNVTGVLPKINGGNGIASEKGSRITYCVSWIGTDNSGVDGLNLVVPFPDLNLYWIHVCMMYVSSKHNYSNYYATHFYMDTSTEIKEEWQEIDFKYISYTYSDSNRKNFTSSSFGATVGRIIYKNGLLSLSGGTTDPNNVYSVECLKILNKEYTIILGLQ